MKSDIHPKLNAVVFVDSSNGIEFPTISTLTSDKTKKINGIDHYVISVDISSASHPFYTGKQTLIDTAGRVDKFRARQEAAKKLKEDTKQVQERRESKMKETPEERVARKAKENTEAMEKAKEEVKAPAKKAAAKTKAAKPEAKAKPKAAAKEKPAAKKSSKK